MLDLLKLYMYSGPSILRPPMGLENVGLYCGWSSNKGHLAQKIADWDQINSLIIKGGLKIEGCKIEGLLYTV